jgi:ABC-2 type transport system permease protein
MPIFDQGYQRWEGQLLGHAWRWWTIARLGVRVQMRNRWVRIVSLLAMVPSFGLVALLVLWGLLIQKPEMMTPLFRTLGFSDKVISAPEVVTEPLWTIIFTIFFNVQLNFAMVLVLLVGPGLISQDLRYNALPLYFSRPLTRFDYFVGKLGVIGFFLGVAAIVPAVIAYVFGVALSGSLSIVGQTFHILLGSITYGLVIVVSAGALMLALSSLSRSSRMVGAMWLGIWFISWMVAGALTGIHEDQIRMKAAEQRAVIRHEMAKNPDRIPNDPNLDGRKRRVEHELQRLEMARRAEIGEARRNNWRIMFAFTGNLARVGDSLLGTDAAWTRLSELVDSRSGRGHLYNFSEMRTPQYPWYWSGAVLLSIVGLSTWVLSMRVRSLDRLK